MFDAYRILQEKGSSHSMCFHAAMFVSYMVVEVQLLA